METALLARIHPATGEVQLANGSHPPALLLKPGAAPATCKYPAEASASPCPGSERVLRTRLDPGDLLILYTDGLTESRRNPLEGEERLVASARRHAEKPLAAIPAAIAAEMHTVVLHPDDTLALAIRIPRPPHGTPR